MLIVLAVLMGLSTHMVVNCGDEDDPDICAAVIGFSPLRGSLIAFAYEGRGRIALRWILTGTASLFLAYLGSKFVLEVLLGR